ncbi:MAG: VWA domain-containing protein [Vicinamibacterales bacterium]
MKALDMAGRLVAATALSVLLATAPQSQGPPPVFRAGVDYVELDVVVTDHRDVAVKDLTKDDFTITERGRVQRIADFRFEYVPPTRRHVDPTTAVPTIDVATNAHAPSGRQWVLVIDDLHIFEQRLVETKRVVQSFLEQVSPDDQVAIVFTGHSNLSQDFTSDLGAQIRAVNRIKDALGFAENPPSSMNPNNPSANPATCGMRFFNARSSLYVLSNVASALSRSSFPRRTLVFVSQGLDYDPFEPQLDLRNLSTDQGSRIKAGASQNSSPNVSPSGVTSNAEICPHEDTSAKEVTDETQLVIERARQSGVSVYTVDPRGVVTAEDVSRNGQADAKALKIELDFLRNVADSTGGRPMVNRNMEQAIPDLIEDNSSFYLLGYYPDPFVRDGQFHDVHVTVARPGLRVRSRVGYEAPRTGKTSAAEAKQTLEDALGAALPVAGLSLRAFAAPVVPSAHGMTTTVTLEVTYATPPDGAKIDDDLQFGIVAIDRDGKIKGSTRHAYHFTGSPRGAATVTYVINDTLDLPAQAMTLRVGASSQALGRAGTVHLPVEVINSSKGDLQISTVVLGFDGPAREAAVPAGVLKDLVPFQPTTTRVFRRDDPLRVFAPIFWGSAEPAASVTLSVRGDGALPPVVTIAARSSGAGRQHHAAIDTPFPLKALAPGAYVLEVAAQLGRGQTARRDVSFEIK